MNFGLKKYSIDNYYYAEIKVIDVKNENKTAIYHTILLKKDNALIDLRYPFKKIKEENINVKEHNIIYWKYPIIDFLFQTNFNMSEIKDFRPLHMMLFFYKYKNLLMYLANYLQSVQYSIEQNDVIKKDRKLF